MSDDYEICRRAPPLKRSELEERAWALAGRAQNYAHSQCARFPKWDDLNAHNQAALMGQALTFICLSEAAKNPALGAN